MERRISCNVEGALPGEGEGSSHVGVCLESHDEDEWDEDDEDEDEDWRRKGETREDRKDGREVGGAGERRMEVRRRGRDMLLDTWYISRV